ncbi:SULTR2 [Symbiodinium sp. CCMP2592]|nr:SULTR2 [Symbiodinium sp. CCMP2592]
MAQARKMLACTEKQMPVSEASTRSSISTTFLEAQSRLGRTVCRRVPLLSWCREMSCKSVRADIIAGLTVGVMVIPQSMSYANIAGLPYIYGMYAACVPALVYAIFGQSRQLAVGPVAMVSLLINAGLMAQIHSGPCPGWDPHAGSKGQLSAEDEFCKNEYVKLAVFTSAVMGLMQIAAMILRMGFLVTFLGHPVTSGFTSGAAIIIGLSQVKYMLGIHLDKSQYVYVTLIDLVRKIEHTKWMTLLLGVLSLAFLLLAKEISKRKPRFSLVGPLAPLFCCAAGTLLLWLCEPLREQFEVSYVGQEGPIPSGIFPVSLDAWDPSNFFKVLPTALSCCLIGYMESIAIGKNLAAKHGYELEAGQDRPTLPETPRLCASTFLAGSGQVKRNPFHIGSGGSEKTGKLRKCDGLLIFPSQPIVSCGESRA